MWDVKTGRPMHTLEGYGYNNMVAFSPDGSCLDTGRGTIALSPALSGSSPLSSQQRIVVKDSWLTVDAEDSIWLPVNYRPGTASVLDQQVAVGYSSGRVMVLKLF